MMDAGLLEKYRKVKALALRGATENERRVAASVLAGMERKYPGIGVAAEAPPPQEPNGAFGFPPPSAGKERFQASGRAVPPRTPEKPKESFVGSVFDWLRDAAEGLREGMSLRDRVLTMADTAATVNTRSLRITVTIPLAALDDVLDEFGDDKEGEIATILSTIVRDEFLSTLASMGTDDGDE